MPIHGRLSRTLAAITLLTFSFAWPATGQNDDSQTRAITNVGASHIRIDNFGRVSDRYYRGAQPMGHDYVDLAALGVKTVINLTSDDANAIIMKARVKAGWIEATVEEPAEETEGEEPVEA